MIDEERTYLVLRRLRVEQASALAGFTYGFVSMGSLLGLMHALGRELAAGPLRYEGRLARLCVLQHSQQVHAFRRHDFEPYRFNQPRHPPQADGTPAPMIEEGKMNLELSIICELEDHDSYGVDAQRLLREVEQLVRRRKLAGGHIFPGTCRRCEKEASARRETPAELNFAALCEGQGELEREVRFLYPFAALCDRSELLARARREQGLTAVDALLQFCCLQYDCLGAEDGSVQWQRHEREEPGYLVPCHMGYRAVTENFTVSEVLGGALRDPACDGVMVEYVHSIAEWVCSVSRFMEYFKEGRMSWEYCQDGAYYLFNQPRDMENDDGRQK